MCTAGACPGKRRGTPTGFSLVEVVVVVGLVAVLIAILLPSLSRVRTVALQSSCASNLRSIGIALSMYCNDNRGRFPQTTHGQPLDRSWIFTLAPYLSNVDRIRISPGDPIGDVRLKNKSTSYVLNEYIAVVLRDAFGRMLEDYTRRDAIFHPAKTITVFTVSDTKAPSTFNDHTHSRNWFREPRDGTWNRILADIKPDRFKSSNSADRSRGSANYLYADGHVESIDASEIKRFADDFFNFAIPPAR
jgi:prepilin-type processing-associated H-X9-DG protein/prepilin-type N-terminal cleavage/methylation domain-containing protein